MFYLSDDGDIGYGECIGAGDTFDSQDGLLAVMRAREFGKDDATELYNSFAGTVGFTDVKPWKATCKNVPYAAAAIWKAIQRFNNESEGYIATPIPSSEFGLSEASGPIITVTSVDGGGAVTGISKPDGTIVAALDGDNADYEVGPKAPEESETMKKTTKRKGLAAKVQDALAKPAKKAAKGPKTGKAAPKSLKAGKTTRKAAGASTGKHRDGTKRERLIGMLKRKDGASVQEIMEAFGWLAHTCRGLISTLNSKGEVKITGERDGKRGHIYKAA